MHAKNGGFPTKVLVKIKWTWKADRWPSKRSGKLYESFWMKIYENIRKWNPETRCCLLDDFSIRDQESFSKVLFFQVVISKMFMFSPKIGEDESHFDDFDVSYCQKVVGSLVFWKIPWIWGTKHGEESSDNSAETEVGRDQGAFERYLGRKFSEGRPGKGIESSSNHQF